MLERPSMEIDEYISPFRARPCRYCKRASPTIYREGWTCLTTTCTAYWMLSTNIGLLPIPPGLNLTYDPEFLAHLATPLGTKIPYDIVPPPPKMGIPDEAGPADSAGSRSLWRGASTGSALDAILTIQAGYARTAVEPIADFVGRSG